MLTTTTVSSRNELEQILQLNQKNLKSNISEQEQKEEGFVTWAYSLDLLEKMNGQAPSVIVKDGDTVVAYALTLLLEARNFHTDLELFIKSLGSLEYRNKHLLQHNFYCMGQICVDKAYRGKGLVNAMYQKHKELYSPKYDFILTEIAPKNARSMNAHARIGFKPIHRFTDAHGEWEIVVWDWR